MKDLLFVDDDRALLDGLRDVFYADRARFRTHFALGGAAALDVLAARPVDVLVTDLRMPSMDGLTLLAEVRRRYPDVTRIVLSGQAELSMAARASALAQRFLVKPCPSALIRSTVEGALALRELIRSERLRAAIGGLGTLPTAPGLYRALTAALADPNADAHRLADIVRRDVGLATRVLKFANSAFYGTGGRPSSVEAAIVALGLNALRHLALTVELYGEAHGSPELEGLERHAVLTAALARRLVAAPEEREVAFTAGLLHDVGQLVLLERAPEPFREAVAACRRGDRPVDEVERERLGASHAEVGAYLLSLWDLPHSIVEPIAHHHDPLPPGPARLDLRRALAIADALAGELGGDRLLPGMDQILADLARGSDLEGWRALARGVAAEIK